MTWEFDVGELIRITWDDQTFRAFTPIGGQWVEFNEMTIDEDVEPHEAAFIAHGWAEELSDE